MHSFVKINQLHVIE